MSIVYLIIFLLVACFLVACFLRSIPRGGGRKEEERQERPVQYAHPPMDLRLPRNPCETCLRWEECNGVDDECPLRKEADTNGKSRQGNDQNCG